MKLILRYIIIIFIINCTAPGRSSYDLASYDYLESIVLWDIGVKFPYFTYTPKEYSYLVNDSLNIGAPIIARGFITSFTISPELPKGLILDSKTGTITGIPIDSQASKEYIIKGSNANYSSSDKIKIGTFATVSIPQGLLKTGQTTVYQTGDDGTYQSGLARVLLVDGKTGLIWQRCSRGQNNDATCSGIALKYDWDGPNSYCKSLSAGGKTWRLPTVNELANLVDYGSKSSCPAIDSTAFPSTSFSYWSSTNAGYGTGYAMVVGCGGVGYSYKTGDSGYYVRCVTGQ